MDGNKTIGATFAINSYTINDTALAGWNLVSVPVPQTNMTPAGIFGDNYQSTPYFVYLFDPAVGYSIPSVMNMGQGYWLGSNSSQVVDAVGSPLSGATLALSNGFNIIGDPFVTDEPIDSLRFTNGSLVKNWADAVSATWLANVLYKYTGSGYDYESSTLHRWTGYWIAMESDGISIQYSANVTEPPAKVAVQVAEPVTATNWSVDLAATLVTTEGKKATDAVASFGVRNDAKTGFDNRYDAPRPPRSPAKDYVEVGFPVNDKSYPTIFGQNYARLFTAPDKTNWAFAVNTSGEGTVTLTWNKDVLTPLGKNAMVTLYDEVGHKNVDMKKAGIYTYKETGTSRQFTIKKVDEVIPTTFMLTQNYPNPFNPSTTIRYGVPVDAVVTLEVYNSLGQKVATLVHGEMDQAGYHEVNFNASAMASGMYFYRMIATGTNGKQYMDSRKMLFIK